MPQLHAQRFVAHSRLCQVADEVWLPCGAQVLFEGILLKPSMVTPGADSPKREKPEVVADYTLKLLKRRVPPAVPGGPLFKLPLFIKKGAYM